MDSGRVDVLVKGADALGVPIPVPCAQVLVHFMEELSAWNERMNLSGIRDSGQVLEKMFLDSLACWRGDWIRAGDAVLDLGSGAGFPGLVLAISAPFLGRRCRVTLVESASKKVQFLQHAIRTLGLENAVAVSGRSEILGRDPEFRERFRVCVSRAVAELRVVLELMVPFVEVGGICLAMKGPRVEAELASSQGALQELGAVVESVHRYSLPFSGDSRSIVVIRKAVPTHERFPRRPGMAAKRPLGAGRR